MDACIRLAADSGRRVIASLPPDLKSYQGYEAPRELLAKATSAVIALLMSAASP